MSEATEEKAEALVTALRSLTPQVHQGAVRSVTRERHLGRLSDHQYALLMAQLAVLKETT